MKSKPTSNSIDDFNEKWLKSFREKFKRYLAEYVADKEVATIDMKDLGKYIINRFETDI